MAGAADTYLVVDKGQLLDDACHHELELELEVVARKDGVVVLLDVGLDALFLEVLQLLEALLERREHELQLRHALLLLLQLACQAGERRGGRAQLGLKVVGPPRKLNSQCLLGPPDLSVDAA
jgi:hypothetical protein